MNWHPLFNVKALRAQSMLNMLLAKCARITSTNELVRTPGPSSFSFPISQTFRVYNPNLVRNEIDGFYVTNEDQIRSQNCTCHHWIAPFGKTAWFWNWFFSSRFGRYKGYKEILNWHLITWTNDGVLLIRTRSNLQWNHKQNSYIFIQEHAFENVLCEMASFFLGLNMLT